MLYSGEVCWSWVIDLKKRAHSQIHHTNHNKLKKYIDGGLDLTFLNQNGF